MTDPLTPLRLAAERRDRAGMRRVLQPREADDGVLDLASNDYLGLARDSRVTEAAASAARRWGAGATGSRLVTGSTALHAGFEAGLADFVGASASLLFSSGYLANIGVVTALTDADTLLVCDAANHASLVDAARLSRATVVVTPHRDVAAVRRVLAGRTQPRAAVVTDAVFSVDGDLAPVAHLHATAREHGALLLVDEAHSLGVMGPGGRGTCAAAGIAGESDVVHTVTLSKSLGAQGGAVLGDPVVMEHLVNTARAFIFDTGLTPAAVGAAARALTVLREQPELAERVRANAAELHQRLGAHGLASPVPDAAVVAVLVGDPGVAVAAARHLLADGIRVGCFRPPSVPDGVSRLRLIARADLTSDAIARAATCVERALAAAISP